MLTTQSPWKNPSRNCYLINTQKPKGKPADKKKKQLNIMNLSSKNNFSSSFQDDKSVVYSRKI